MKRSKRLISTTALLLSAVILFTDSASLYGEPLSPKAAEKEYAIGSDGVAYNAGYISKKAFDSLEEEAKDAYIFACDEIADMYSAGIGLSDVYLATDEDGNVYVRYSVPAVTLAGEVNEFTEAVIADISENGLPEDISLNDIEIPEEEPASEEPETEEPEAPEAKEPEAEEPVEEETFTGFISENLEFFDDTGLEEEEVSFDEDEDELSFEANDYDSLLSYYNENHFKDQLSELESGIYTAAKKAFVNKGSSSFTYKCEFKPEDYTDMMHKAIVTALSAVICTYPNSFNKFDLSTEPVTVTAKFDKKTWNYKVKLTTSPFYKSKLQKEAKKVVKEVVAAAYDEAKTYYNDDVFDITYGIVNYFNKWIRKNADYASAYANTTDEYVIASAEYYYSHTAYGVLLKGYGVCDSYARAMSWFLDEAGVTNMYVVNGTHAYNYVLMPDDGWYIIDTMKNDLGGSIDAFLTVDKSAYSSEKSGVIFEGSRNLTYPDLSANNYSANSKEDLYINIKNVFALSVGKKKTLTIQNTYYDKYIKKWSTDSTNIATVSSSGKVTAKKAGNTKIHCEVAGRDVFTAIYVYQLKNLNFSNKKTTLTATYRNKDTRWDNDRDTISLTVNQNNKQVSAQSLYLFDSNLKYPTASSSNKSVAEVSIGEGDFHGDTIDLKIVPKKTGKTTITVKFGGKTAKLTYNVKQDLMDTEDEKWFNELPYTEQPYKEKSYKPAVTKTDICPKNVTCKVSYKDNINAGTATVTISGTGNYSGTVTRTFKITPRDLSYYGEYTCTESKRYTGSAVKPKVTVTYKKTTLVKNKDYKVSFKQGFKYIDNPVNAGKYTVVIEGINNYEGTMDPAEFEIKKIASADLSLSCPDKVKWKNDSVVTPNIKLMYGDYVIPQIIEGATQQNYKIEYYKVENGNRKKEVPARKGTYVAVLTLFPNTGNISISTNEKTGEKIESLEKTFVIK